MWKFIKIQLEKKEERAKKELELKEKELKLIQDKKIYEDNLIAKIRKEEADRQSYFEAKLKQKLSEARKNLENDKRLRSAQKKKKVGITTVVKSMSSLIRKLEDVGKSNDIITPDSSDFDEPTPTNNKKSIIKSTNKEISIDIDNEIIRQSPIVEQDDTEDETETETKAETETKTETIIDVSSNEQ